MANKLAVVAGEVACVIIVMHNREGKTKLHRISDRPAKLAVNELPDPGTVPIPHC